MYHRRINRHRRINIARHHHFCLLLYIFACILTKTIKISAGKLNLKKIVFLYRLLKSSNWVRFPTLLEFILLSLAWSHLEDKAHQSFFVVVVFFLFFFSKLVICVKYILHAGLINNGIYNTQNSQQTCL